MAVTLREVRTAYDNIAVGEAVSDEEHFLVGEDPPAQAHGGGSNIAVGETSDPDNIIVAEDTHPYLENVVVGG